MAIVGYDDVRGAFLVMNSWGDKWGERGFCWFDYRVMKTISPSANNFVIEAYVLLDDKAAAAPMRRPTLRGLASLDAALQLDGNLGAD